MADDDRTRSRRRRLHARGDHSICLPGRCTELLAGRAAPLVVRPPESSPVTVSNGDRVPGGIEAAVISFVEQLPYVLPDPRAALAQVAVRLAQRVDETGALPAAVRELRVLLVQLTEVPNGPAGVVDEVRLRAAQRRLDRVLAAEV